MGKEALRLRPLHSLLCYITYLSYFSFFSRLRRIFNNVYVAFVYFLFFKNFFYFGETLKRYSAKLWYLDILLYFCIHIVYVDRCL